MSKAKYLFLDLETTGLEPDDGSILEYAAIAVDADLAQVGDPIDRVLHFDVDRAIDGFDGYVRKMHTDNGLWDDCRRSHADVFDMIADLRRIIGAHEWAEGKPMLAGASIHFDRSWLAYHLPGSVFAEFHHRMYDVSAIKLMRVDMLGEPFAKAEAHRAMADVVESLTQARQIRTEIREGRWSPCAR